jgi:hypothetical protein
MNRPRDPKGRYIKTKLDLSTKVPFDLFGGRNILLINSTDQYQKSRVISTQRAKTISEESKTGSTIEQNKTLLTIKIATRISTRKVLLKPIIIR